MATFIRRRIFTTKTNSDTVVELRQSFTFGNSCSFVLLWHILCYLCALETNATGTLIQCLPDFVASIIHVFHFQTTDCFDSPHPTTSSYSPLSSSSHFPLPRSTHWHHPIKHAYLVSSEDGETAQADTNGKCRSTTSSPSFGESASHHIHTYILCYLSLCIGN